MIARCLVLVFALSASACTPETANVPHTNVHELPNDPGPLDALARRFARLRDRMRERGGRQVHGPARYFALEAEGTVVPVDLPADRCTTFVALGGGTAQEVVATVYDQDGAEIVRDEIANEGALVHVCPPARRIGERSGTFYLTLESKSGAGAILVAQFESARDAQPHFDGLFADVLVAEVPAREVETLLARSRGALRARGFQPLSPSAFDSLSQGGVLRRSVPMQTEHCYVIVARGSSGVRDVDVSLYDADGAEVGRDLRGDAEPLLEYCPTASGTYRVEARLFQGAGAVGLMMLEGPLAHEARSTVPGPTPSEEGDDAHESRALRTTIDALVARGYTSSSSIASDVQTSPGEVRVHDIMLESGCSVIVGAATRDDTDLDLYLSDSASSAVLDEDVGMQSLARVSACVTEPTAVRLATKTYGTNSAYSVALLRAPTTIGNFMALGIDESTAAFRARGYRVAAENHLTLEEGERQTIEVAIAGPACVALAVAGAGGIDDVDMFLKDAAGHLLASESGPEPYAAVSHCSERAQTLSLELVMYRGGGAIALERLEAPR